MKLTDEMLSRVLSAHEYLNLARGGNYCNSDKSMGCLFQVALADRDMDDLPVADAFDVSWFDSNYESYWTIAQFLAQLAARGLT